MINFLFCIVLSLGASKVDQTHKFDDIFKCSNGLRNNRAKFHAPTTKSSDHCINGLTPIHYICLMPRGLICHFRFLSRKSQIIN